MKKRLAVLKTFAAVAALGGLLGMASWEARVSPGADGAVRADGVYAFVNVTVIPMDEERLLRRHTVVVERGRITAVGPNDMVEVRANATRIDGTGKYLVPGLSEMHGHTPVPGGDPNNEFVENMMFLYVANGVTTVRGMLGARGQLELKAMANSGEMIGPTLYLAGPSFNGNSVSSPAEAAERVRQQKRDGWDLLKVHPGLTREEYDSMAFAAAEVGIRFGGHVPEPVGLVHALKMGQQTFDHIDGFIAHLDAADKSIDEAKLRDIVRLTKEAGAWVVPTQVLWEVGVLGLGSTNEFRQRPEMRYWPQQGNGGVDSWVQRHTAVQSNPNWDVELQTIHARNRNRVLEALVDGGVGILMGTDSPQMFSVPGFSLHREMQAMVDAGMTPYQVLESGTKNVGVYFQAQDSFGTVAIGRRADLILLNSNPLQDIEHVADRAGVMVRGRWIPESEIQSRLERIAAAIAGGE